MSSTDFTFHHTVQHMGDWALQIPALTFNMPRPCQELNEQATASQSLSCRLCLMMSWITYSVQRWRFRGRAVGHYGKQPPASLSDRFWVSQIVHKFLTWSHKCQAKGGKQTDESLQHDGSANDYYWECDRRQREGWERLGRNNAEGVFKEDSESKSGRFEKRKKMDKEMGGGRWVDEE